MKKQHIYRQIVFVVAMALLLLLVGFQIIPLTINEPDWLSQTALQTARSQRLTKNALILAYRPEDEHAQAINEMQNMLPVWELQQTRLHEIRNPEMSALIDQAQPDYVAMDTATRQLLAHPTGKPDMTQVEIILQHERNYVLLMSQVSVHLQARIETFNLNLALTQNAVVVLLVVTTILLFALPRQVKQKGPNDDTTQQDK